jgi:DNA end-binding protein Ku
MGDLLAMQVLDYDFQVNKPQAYEEMVPESKAEPEEVEMARKLIEASVAKKFDLAAYPDMYTKRLTELVEAKVAGKEIVAPPAAEHAQVLNLMDALKQSVAQLGPTPEAKLPKKVASSQPAAKKAKRKSS